MKERQSSNKFLACYKRPSFSPTFTAAFLELNGKWEAKTQYMTEELREHTIIKDRRKLVLWKIARSMVRKTSQKVYILELWGK